MVEQSKGGGCCGGGSKSATPVTSGNTGLKMVDPTKPKTGGRPRKGGPIEAKIVLLGESGVGKSSIALRFC